MLANLKVILWISLLTVFVAGCRMNTMKPGNNHTCKVVEYDAAWVTADGTQKSITHFLVYDSQEELVEDSVASSDKLLLAVNGVIHFTYAGDSVIATGTLLWGPTVVLMSKEFRPLMMTTIFGSVVCRAFYNPQGTLQKIISIMHKGTSMEDTVTSDSIIYLNDNIVAYREVYSSGKDHSVWPVCCTYDTSKFYDPAFNPTERIFALSTMPGSVPSLFNVQVYSKDLLKSENWGGVSRYNYMFDTTGKITHIYESKFTCCSDSGLSRVNETHYKFKYLCR
jgi:hypothetical protein